MTALRPFCMRGEMGGECMRGGRCKGEMYTREGVACV